MDISLNHKTPGGQNLTKPGPERRERLGPSTYRGSHLCRPQSWVGHFLRTEPKARAAGEELAEESVSTAGCRVLASGSEEAFQDLGNGFLIPHSLRSLGCSG